MATKIFWFSDLPKDFWSKHSLCPLEVQWANSDYGRISNFRPHLAYTLDGHCGIRWNDTLPYIAFGDHEPCLPNEGQPCNRLKNKDCFHQFSVETNLTLTKICLIILMLDLILIFCMTMFSLKSHQQKLYEKKCFLSWCSF